MKSEASFMKLENTLLHDAASSEEDNGRAQQHTGISLKLKTPVPVETQI